MSEHNPGGKVKIPIATGTIGDARFSACGRYRHYLSRTWGDTSDGEMPPFALWIGMNPSTADAGANDPTVAREVKYTRERLGLSGYVKCNVMDYRATDPKALLSMTDDERCTATNLETIRTLAPLASKVIVAFGALPKKLRCHSNAVIDLLKSLDLEMWCVGLTKDGSPRHPLYVRADAPILAYDGTVI